MNKTIKYEGARVDWLSNKVLMSVNDYEQWANLPLYLDEINHSPTGFEWGYNGSGPSQLAYAMLRSYFEISLGKTPQAARQEAEKHYFRFRSMIVANFEKEDWVLTGSDIENFLKSSRA